MLKDEEGRCFTDSFLELPAAAAVDDTDESKKITRLTNVKSVCYGQIRKLNANCLQTLVFSCFHFFIFYICLSCMCADVPLRCYMYDFQLFVFLYSSEVLYAVWFLLQVSMQLWTDQEEPGQGVSVFCVCSLEKQHVINCLTVVYYSCENKGEFLSHSSRSLTPQQLSL